MRENNPFWSGKLCYRCLKNIYKKVQQLLLTTFITLFHSLKNYYEKTHLVGTPRK